MRMRENDSLWEFLNAPNDQVIRIVFATSAYFFCNINIGLYGEETKITFYSCNVINGKSKSIEHVEP